MWSDEAKRHVSCETKAKRKEAVKTLDARMLVTQVFDGLPEGWGLPWKDAVERIQKLDELKPSGARRKLATLVSDGLVRHAQSKYYKAH